MPENGDHVLVQAKVSIYPDRGNYQLIISRLEAVGEGVLQKRFEKLKNKLSQEGLFDGAHKRTLPEYPNTIGVITSETGAAIRDILSVLKRRYPIANIIIYPCLVQGTQAAESIIAALNQANQTNTQDPCDVLILARGGGSMEDLWSFNEEKVARAVFNSELPIVTGIGHEIDFTICDFVADVRAPTPSVAAETVTPDQDEIKNNLDNYQKYLTSLICAVIEAKHSQLKNLEKRLAAQDPRQIIQAQQQKIDFYSKQLIQLIKQKFNFHQQQIAHLASQLNTLSPLAVLSRGYAVLSKNSQVIDSTKKVQKDDEISAKIADGDLELKVLKITKK